MGFFCCGSHLLPTDKEESNTYERANDDSGPTPTSKLPEFTFQEIAEATQNFSPECFEGEGSSGAVYRGELRKTLVTVSISHFKNSDKDNHREFLQIVSMLSFLNHPNHTKLIGYCVERDKKYYGRYERYFVREFLPLGPLEKRLHDRSKPPLDWHTRMKIALGVARGLECLHHASPPIIYRYLKPSNILLDNDFNAKLSNFRKSRLGPSVKDMVSFGCCGGFSIMITNNDYDAPEHIFGILTVKADVYSFGIVLLELVTGRRVVDMSATKRTEQFLVDWALPKLKKPKKFPELADPRLQGNYPAKGLKGALALAAKCLESKETARPFMSDVVAAIMCLTSDNLNDKPVLAV